MKTHLRQLGNSKAVLLPSALLSISGLQGALELIAEPGKISITNAKRPREGWFELASGPFENTRDEDVLAELDSEDLSDDEWVW